MAEVDDRSPRAANDDVERDLPPEDGAASFEASDHMVAPPPPSNPGPLDQQSSLGFPKFNVDKGAGFIDFGSTELTQTAIGDAAPKNAAAAKNAAGDRPSVSQMTSWFKDNFDKLDKDGDGSITKKEMDQALLDPKLATGNGAIFLASANDLVTDMRDQFGGKKDGEEPGGITRDSLKAIEEAAGKQDSPEVKEKLGISSLAGKDVMKKLDGDGDNCITKDELETALKRDDWTPEQRASLEKLQEKFKDVAATTDDEVPPMDAGGGGVYPGYTQKPQPDENGKVPDYVSKLDLEKYAGGQAPLINRMQDSINTHTDRARSDYAVNQGDDGDCFLLGPLEALHKQDPQSLQNMIKDEGNGKVTVTFPGDPTHPVTIDKPTEGEQVEFAKGNAGIIEKAFAQYMANLKPEERAKYMGQAPDTPPTLIQNELKNGGLSKPTMELLTGKPAESSQPASMTEEDIKAKLTQAAKEGRIVSIATDERQEPGSGIQGRHAYSVSYDAKTGMVTLTNPNKPSGDWIPEPTNPDGTAKDGKADGSFQVTIAQFQKIASEMYRSTK
ncbi:MAG: hypothetical protein U0105_14555 [Candidatus Obscuribacterales bacterium]